jgi:ATP-dependent exoDNAse (exonuclease V) beta subunit
MLGIGISAGIAKMLEIVLHRYGFMDHLAALPDGRRRCANARKLLEMASCFGKRELPGVDSFLDYVHKLRYSAEREADSDSSEVDAVRLMTVHKAKGLQSPVIFVADMSRNMERSPGRVVFDPDFGLAMEVKDPLSGRIERSMGFKLIADRVARREISEEKRLLYVAMTRAEEHLILVGHSDLKGVSESSYSELRSWTGWLEKALRLGPESKSGILRYGGTEVDFRRDPKSEAPKNAATHERSDAPKIARHARIELPFSPRELSVSGVLDYLDCPARFRLRHVLGLSEGGRFILRDEDESPAAALGTRVHGILESADFKNDDPLSVLDPLPEEVRTPVERFYGSRWFREIHAADLVIKEKFFRVRASDARVIGRMDVVYHGSDGWTILDYKTGRGEDRERYELQVGIYSFAVKRLFGEFPARSALLLLSADEEWVVETSDGDAARRGMDAVNDVYSSVSAGRFDPKPGDSCNHCSYSKICQNQG